jgi:membrane-bound serine protease (ClpP class)
MSVFLYLKIFEAFTSEIQIGQEAMLGKEGLVIEKLNPQGKIQYANEIWEAVSLGKRYSKGARMKITGFEGLRLLLGEGARSRD